MMIARTLLVAVGALLSTAAAAEAGDGHIRISGGGIEVRGSWGRRHHRPVRKVWVPGHYETRVERVWVPGHHRVEQVPAEYQEFRDRYGRVHRILVRPACTRRILVPGHYETRNRRVWVPGHYEVRSAPEPHRHVSHRRVRR